MNDLEKTFWYHATFRELRDSNEISPELLEKLVAGRAEILGPLAVELDNGLRRLKSAALPLPGRREQWHSARSQAGRSLH